MKKQIVIIGAGYTGLAAALRLAESGKKVTVLECSSAVGGLASDFIIEGKSLERAYHHIFKTDTSIISLATELGIVEKIKWHDSSVSLYYNNTLYPFKGAIDLIKFKPLSPINRIRAGLVVLYLQKNNNWQKLQEISAYNWMKKAAGQQVTEVIWEPLLRGKFDKFFDGVSMAWLWARVHTRAQSREIGGEKLGYFEGGFQVFTNTILKRLEEMGVGVKTNIKISSISNVKNGKVKIVFEDKTNKIYDGAIVTTPSTVFASLIKGSGQASSEYIKQLKSIDYLGTRIMVFSSDQDISPYYWHNINDPSLPFLVFINHTRLIHKDNYNGKYIYYIAAYIAHDQELYNCSDKQLEKAWLKSLLKIFPDFDAKKINEKHFFSFPHGQHIVDINYFNKIPSPNTPLENVYLSNFSQIYPEDRGTNYAIRDGENIAKLVK